MFCETLGRLLVQASEELVGATHSADDPRRQREVRQIATLLRRTGVIWPRLFETLECECGLLEAACGEVCAAFQANGMARPACPDPATGTPAWRGRASPPIRTLPRSRFFRIAFETVGN